MRLRHSIRNLLYFYIVFIPYVLFGDLNNGLVAWYPFDGNASDMSGNDKHGTVHGATLAIDRHGQINKAYSFDGVNDKIVISGAEESTPGEITVTAWVKIQSTSGEQMIVRKGDVSKWWALHYYNSALTWSFDDDSAKRVAQSTISPSEDWVFVVGIRKPGVSNQIFVNGNIANSTTDNNQLVSIPSDLTIGGQNNIRFYDGPIDDIRIYDRALSAAEVLALYNLEKAKDSINRFEFSDRGKPMVLRRDQCHRHLRPHQRLEYLSGD